MPGMRFKGVEDRAKEVRQAANRLHWEIEFAEREGTPLWEIQAALSPLAEALGSLKNVMERMDALIPDGPAKISFKRELEFYIGYHEIPR